jgi:hypothetical protein
MITMRKIQLSAGAVILNGLLSLTPIYPSTALANPCAQIITCYNRLTCSANGLSFCQSIALSGCTATSFVCAGYNIECGAPILGVIECNYN